MKTKKITLNELKVLVKKIIKEEIKPNPSPDNIIDSLQKITSDIDLYNICYAIAPNSVASGWDREQLLDIINDVLNSRF
jgi:hypothetical protein